MMTWFQILPIGRKHFSPLAGFLFILTLSWYVWTWVVPPQPRIIIRPFNDSDFVAFTSDSRILITREFPGSMLPVVSSWGVTVGRPSRIQLWNTQDGTLLQTFRDEWAEMDCVLPSPDGLHLVGWARGKPGKSPNFIKMYDLLRGEPNQSAILPCKYGSPMEFQFSADGNWLGISPRSGYGGHFYLWRIGSDNLVFFDGHGERLSFSEDGEFLAASEQGPREFRVEVWRLSDLAQPLRKYKWPAYEGFVFPDCRTAATYQTYDEIHSKPLRPSYGTWLPAGS
jgi:hypothetical protein